MDGWLNVFPHNSTHKHTHNGARFTRELFASSSGSDLDGGRGDEPGPRRCDAMRCDANETCWGNTVLCILRCAFWNIGTGYPHSGFFCFSGRFFLFLSELSFCPDLGKSKKSENKHHMHFIIIIIIIPQGGAGREKAGATCAYFWSPGKYRRIISLSCEPVSFIPTLLLCFYTYDTKPPLFFSSPADPHPRAPEAPGSLSTPLHPSLSNTQPDTPGRRGIWKGWYFHPSGSGGTGG